MVRNAAFVILMFLVGCSGAGSQPDAPTDESGGEPSGSEEAPSSSEASESAEGSAEKPASGGESKDAPASADDLRTVLQLVIDDESLDPFLHLDQPGRFPLAVSGPNLPDGLTKSTKPVKIVEGTGSKKEAVLAFTKIEVQGKHATVQYRYDIEGVRGSATLDKKEHGWELTRSKVVEH
jgi:hypothetical protein